MGACVYHKSILTNGLRIVTTELPHARSVSTSIFLGIGSRNENGDQRGICHFLEHMLFKGTETRPTAKDISIAIEQIGGILNAETGKEVTVYWNKVSHRHWKLAIELLSDVLRHSRFDSSEVEKERGVIIEELSMLFDSPGEWVHVLVDEILWGEHPLGRDIGGDRESVSGISRDDLTRFLDQSYSPDNAVVAVAGAIDHFEILDEIEKLLGNWQRRSPVSWEPVNGRASESKIIIRDKDTEQAHLCLAVPSYSFVHPDRFALDLLNVILGEGMSSRLFQEIREKRGLGYDVQSYVTRFRDAGSLVVYTSVDPARVDETLRAIVGELDGVRLALPSDEVQRAKDFWKGRIELRLEETRSLASWLGSQELFFDRILTVEDVVARIDAVTPEDLMRVASDVFRHERFHVAAIGPGLEESAISKVLA